MYTTEFVDIDLCDLLTRIQSLKHQGMRFVQLCAELPEGGIDLVYTFYDETCDNALNLCVRVPEGAEVPSIQDLYFAAFSYENEAHDLFGVQFINMKLDFGGHFFELAEKAPMTVITPEMKADARFESAALTLMVGGEEIVDDETFDQAEFLRKVAACPECPKSACPSPERYQEAFLGEEEHLYAVTLSAELSGSYNSAVLGKSLALEKHPEKKIHVFNSRSASVGETLIAKKIAECEEKGMSFSRVVDTVEKYIDSQVTYFVLENLETLRKNGRLSKVKAFVASALKIKPVMGSTPEGTICQLDQARGINKALVKMVDYIVSGAENTENKVLAISHCNCRERAEMVRDAILEKIQVKDTILLDTAGVSSMYANDGGVIVVL